MANKYQWTEFDQILPKFQQGLPARAVDMQRLTNNLGCIFEPRDPAAANPPLIPISRVEPFVTPAPQAGANWRRVFSGKVLQTLALSGAVESLFGSAAYRVGIESSFLSGWSFNMARGGSIAVRMFKPSSGDTDYRLVAKVNGAVVAQTSGAGGGTFEATINFPDFSSIGFESASGDHGFGGSANGVFVEFGLAQNWNQLPLWLLR